MMKKLFALMMALCLVLSSTTFALAAPTTSANWDDMAGLLQDLGLSGAFHTLNAYPISYWIPDDMQYEDPSSSESEQGCRARYATKDGEFGFAIIYYTSSSYASAEQLAEYVRSSEYAKDVNEVTLNGLDAMSYKSLDDSWVYVCIVMPDTQMLMFSFYGVTSTYLQQKAAVIAGSIQKAPDENTSGVAAMTWDDMASACQQMGLETTFATLYAAPYKFAIPSYMDYVTPTEDEQANGVVAAFRNGDGSRGIFATYSSPSFATPEDLLAQLKSMDDVEQCGMAIVNGISCVYYRRSTYSDRMLVSYYLSDGMLIELTYVAVDADAASFFSEANILAVSFMAAE